MAISRRDLLAGTIAGAGSYMLSNSCRAQAKTKAGFYDPYEMVKLGKTGLKVSRVGIGTGMKGWMRQSNQTRLGDKGFQKLMQESYEKGIRLFDLADLYGSHEYMARAFSNLSRDKYTIVSKIWFRPRGIPEKERPDADVVVKRFLKELKTEYIDILQIHCQTDGEWPDKMNKQMDIMAGLKEKGIIRSHGISAHSLPALEAAAKCDWVDVVHTRINAYKVRMDGTPEQVVAALKKIHDAGKGLIGMKLCGEGTFRNDRDKREKSIAMALNEAHIDSMIVGFEKAAEIDDFAESVRKTVRK